MRNTMAGPHVPSEVHHGSFSEQDEMRRSAVAEILSSR